MVNIPASALTRLGLYYNVLSDDAPPEPSPALSMRATTQ